MWSGQSDNFVSRISQSLHIGITGPLWITHAREWNPGNRGEDAPEDLLARHFQGEEQNRCSLAAVLARSLNHRSRFPNSRSRADLRELAWL